MGQDFSKFKALKPSLMASLDKLLSTDIAKLMPLLQQQEQKREKKKSLPGVLDGDFLGTFKRGYYKRDPFKQIPEEEEDSAIYLDEWVVEKHKPKYDEIFNSLCPVAGKLTGTKVRDWMMTTLLPNSVLAHIWRLSDVDCDGMLDNEEFALALHFVEGKLEGYWLPHELPPHLVPPSKRPQHTDDEEQYSQASSICGKEDTPKNT